MEKQKKGITSYTYNGFKEILENNLITVGTREKNKRYVWVDKDGVDYVVLTDAGGRKFKAVDIDLHATLTGNGVPKILPTGYDKSLLGGYRLDNAIKNAYILMIESAISRRAGITPEALQSYLELNESLKRRPYVLNKLINENQENIEDIIKKMFTPGFNKEAAGAKRIIDSFGGIKNAKPRLEDNIYLIKIMFSSEEEMERYLRSNKSRKNKIDDNKFTVSKILNQEKGFFYDKSGLKWQVVVDPSMNGLPYERWSMFRFFNIYELAVWGISYDVIRQEDVQALGIDAEVLTENGLMHDLNKDVITSRSREYAWWAREDAYPDYWGLIPGKLKKQKKVSKVKIKEYNTSDPGVQKLFVPFISDDQHRPNMSGLYAHEGGLVATNAHLLASLPVKHDLKEGLYCFPKVCKGVPIPENISDDGIFINDNENYPRFKNVIPDLAKERVEIEINPLLSFANTITLLKYYPGDGYDKSDVGYNHKNARNIVFLKVSKNIIIALDGDFLKEVLSFFLKLGHDKVVVYSIAPEKPVCFSTPGNHSTPHEAIGAYPLVLQMPVMAFDYGGELTEDMFVNYNVSGQNNNDLVGYPVFFDLKEGNVFSNGHESPVIESEAQAQFGLTENQIKIIERIIKQGAKDNRSSFKKTPEYEKILVHKGYLYASSDGMLYITEILDMEGGGKSLIDGCYIWVKGALVPDLNTENQFQLPGKVVGSLGSHLEVDSILNTDKIESDLLVKNLNFKNLSLIVSNFYQTDLYARSEKTDNMRGINTMVKISQESQETLACIQYVSNYLSLNSCVKAENIKNKLVEFIFPASIISIINLLIDDIGTNEFTGLTKGHFQESEYNIFNLSGFKEQYLIDRNQTKDGFISMLHKYHEYHEKIIDYQEKFADPESEVYKIPLEALPSNKKESEGFSVALEGNKKYKIDMPAKSFLSDYYVIFPENHSYYVKKFNEHIGKKEAIFLTEIKIKPGNKNLLLMPIGNEADIKKIPFQKTEEKPVSGTFGTLQEITNGLKAALPFLEGKEAESLQEIIDGLEAAAEFV